jgi:hypothetical protein
VKKWFQAFAFKCNSYRYTASELRGLLEDIRDELLPAVLQGGWMSATDGEGTQQPGTAGGGAADAGAQSCW